MTTKGKIIIAVLVVALGYALSIDPNGQYLVPTAKLIKEKAIVEDNRVHSLDLRKLRSAETPK